MKYRQIATFALGETVLGVDILLVKEVYRHMVISRVPDTPDHIKGLMNLRGRVVTVIDLNVCLNRPPSEDIGDYRLLILKTREEISDCIIDDCLNLAGTGDDIVGFLIDRMDDVMMVRVDEIFPPPLNVVEVDLELIEGVIRRENGLVILLKIPAVLERVMDVITDSTS